MRIKKVAFAELVVVRRDEARREEEYAYNQSNTYLPHHVSYKTYGIWDIRL